MTMPSSSLSLRSLRTSLLLAVLLAVVAAHPAHAWSWWKWKKAHTTHTLLNKVRHNNYYGSAYGGHWYNSYDPRSWYHYSWGKASRDEYAAKWTGKTSWNHADFDANADAEVSSTKWGLHHASSKLPRPRSWGTWTGHGGGGWWKQGDGRYGSVTTVEDGPVIKIQVDVVQQDDDDDDDGDGVQVAQKEDEEVTEDDDEAAEDDDDAVDAAGLTQLSDVDSSTTTIPIYSSDTTDGIPSYSPLTIRSNGG